MSSIDLLEKLVNYGVLGVVVVWFMMRFEKIVSENTKAINDMRLVIEKLCEKMNS